MDNESEQSYRPPRSKMSMTPSWVMLGFALGAGFVLALPSREKKLAPRPMELRIEPPPRSPVAPPQLSTVEAVFASWGQYAVWEDETAEVALWNTTKEEFAECYEVRRVGGMLYFRTIPRLTRRVINHGKPRPDSPLQFTETEEQYREWVNHGRTERRAENRPGGPTETPTLPTPVTPTVLPAAVKFDPTSRIKVPPPEPIVAPMPVPAVSPGNEKNK